MCRRRVSTDPTAIVIEQLNGLYYAVQVYAVPTA